MNSRIVLSLHLAVVSWTLVAPRPADAIPAFARKYETSCLTCHTVYPKLTPFGEAFRRNGYRFPGVDSDYVKQGTVALGQEANKKTFPSTVWPATIPISSVVAIGVNGQAFAFPQKSASIPRQNNDLRFSLDDLVAEGHIWAGAALDDSITLWAEVTFADGGAEVEHAQVLLNDLVGPRHAVNLVVGKGFPTLTSFGPHSSYLGDAQITTVPVTGITGLSSDPFTLVDNFNGAELTGVWGGRLDWSAGVTAGKNASGVKVNSENAYAHVGCKLGGMRLDGEGSKGPKDALKPWSEDAVTLDVFGFHSREMLDLAPVAPGTGNTSRTLGAAARGQLGSAELNLGFYAQQHDRGAADLSLLRTDVEWAELSYVLFPWMVPAVRAERIGFRPSGGSKVHDVHLMPGVAFLLRANVKAVLVANFEFANGFPTDASGGAVGWDGGNADWGNFVGFPKDPAAPDAKLNEFQSIALFLAWAI